MKTANPKVLIAYDVATRRQFLEAAKWAGLDQSRGPGGSAFHRAFSGQTVTVREYESMVDELQAMGYYSVDITNPNWIRLTRTHLT